MKLFFDKSTYRAGELRATIDEYHEWQHNNAGCVSFLCAAYIELNDSSQALMMKVIELVSLNLKLVKKQQMVKPTLSAIVSSAR
jgi:hypothetical protein